MGIFWLSGQSKLRSEGRGGLILLVSEGISFQFSPLKGSPSIMSSSIASCHAYSLCGSGCCLCKVSGRPGALFFVLHDSVQSPCPPASSPGSLSKAHLPQMRPSLTQTPSSLSPGHNISTSPPDLTRVVVFCVLSPAPHSTSPALLHCSVQPGTHFLKCL